MTSSGRGHKFKLCSGKCQRCAAAAAAVGELTCGPALCSSVSLINSLTGLNLVLALVLSPFDLLINQNVPPAAAAAAANDQTSGVHF